MFKTEGKVSYTLTQNAQTVLNKRYLLRDEHGSISETPAQLFERVSIAVARAETRERAKWAKAFFELMASGKFIPNSPTLINSGKKDGQLSACYVLPIEDSLDGIFDSLKNAAKIHQSGGGTGFSFSRLRAKGSEVKSSHGVASGPVSFMRIYDAATETIKQGGTRRGANMAILRVDHPDVLEFIDCKRDQKSILNFNISLAITDSFMSALRSGGSIELRNPGSTQAERTIRASEIFDRLVRAAWECGDPGVVFIDRINRFNPTPKLGLMESTNPCGEQPLLGYESCNLGSLNLGRFVREARLDWSELGEATTLAVRFLDNVIDVNVYPIPECEKITLRNRKIGLGVMGFADALLLMRLPYDSPEALIMGEKIMSFVDRRAKQASAELAKKRGAFANWKGSLWDELGYPKMRNATVSTIAPTGTISIIAGCSSGIEPIFAGIFHRNVLDGERLLEVHPAVGQALAAAGVSMGQACEEDLPRLLGKAWTPAPSVSVEAHVKMQAAFQRHSDSAVSKTINLPEKATPGDVAKAYWLAYESGCKGITVYRDKSRSAQVLERVTTPENPGVVCEDCG